MWTSKKILCRGLWEKWNTIINNYVIVTCVFASLEWADHIYRLPCCLPRRTTMFLRNGQPKHWVIHLIFTAPECSVTQHIHKLSRLSSGLGGRGKILDYKRNQYLIYVYSDSSAPNNRRLRLAAQSLVKACNRPASPLEVSVWRWQLRSPSCENNTSIKVLQLFGAMVTTDECKSKDQRVCVWRRSGRLYRRFMGLFRPSLIPLWGKESVAMV